MGEKFQDIFDLGKASEEEVEVISVTSEPGELEETRIKAVTLPNTFNQEWPLNLVPGRIFFFEGKIKKNAVLFYINLACGMKEMPDIALHVAVHFHYNKIIRNSRINGFWGDEEYAATRRFPFHRNKPFNLQILCTENEFMIATNSQHTCAFAYRIPLSYVEILHVAGDITLSRAHERRCKSYPITIDPAFPHCLILDKNSKVDNVTTDKVVSTPMLISLPSGFTVGQKLILLGAIKLFPHSFYINLQTETRVWPTCDVALQIKVELKEKVTNAICNSYLNNKWGHPEVCEVDVLRTGHCFVLRIDCSQECYSVTLNKIKILEFAHRTYHDVVRGLLIQGDIYMDILKLK